MPDQNLSALENITLIPSNPNLFFSKNDAEDPRLGDIFKHLPLTEQTTQQALKPDDTVVVGYPDDDGIRLNGGRPGAAEAPRLIRQFLYKMTPPTKNKNNFYDLGDLEVKTDLPQRHEQAQNLIHQLQLKKTRTVSLGGGHDYGFSDASGFVKAALELAPHEKPMVINFDAHLDVRPTKQGFNSGTSFYRLLSEYSNRIDFAEIGLQPQCNSVYHREWAEKMGATLFDFKDIHAGKIQNLFSHPFFKKLTKTTPVFVSFDIDCLSSSEAGGCSQSWATGLTVQECLDFLTELYKLSNVRGLGVYEVSPPLDHDFKTSKTAALLTYHFLFQGLT
ncbi:MAG: formimidoylglutamase [Bdellovibrio sp.]|nr:formimidoylglutamase [Bdellovibrio sp.]